MASGKSNNTGTDVARPYESLVNQIQLAAMTDATDPNQSFDIAAQVMDKMSQATSVDDLFDSQSGVNALEDFVGQPINVTTVSFRQSAEEYRKGGVGAYVYVAGVTDNGEEFGFTSGATNVVAFMYKADDLGLISPEKPLRCKIMQRNTTNGKLQTVRRA